MKAVYDGEEQRWKAGQFMNIKADAPFYEAAFNTRLASKLIEGRLCNQANRPGL